ncbi:hypothetical protein AB0O34_36930, partial [Sphaerisporangium sp. NPDC088356]|uniref:hypothetical protein n=1 Tax=Sphaerisporangium sp. NPDC088356 TaxID=3154871 RepID=UPI00344218F2
MREQFLTLVDGEHQRMQAEGFLSSHIRGDLVLRTGLLRQSVDDVGAALQVLVNLAKGADALLDRRILGAGCVVVCH